MEINQKVFKIENKFYSTSTSTGLLLMINDVLSEIDFADIFTVQPNKYPDSNEIKGYCVLEKYFNVTEGNFTFLKNDVKFKVELVEVNEDKLVHSKIIKMRNPVVIMDEHEITEDQFSAFINQITEVYFESERQKKVDIEEKEKPKKIKLYENPVYEKDKKIYLKKGFVEYKNGNFRMLHNPNQDELDESPDALLVLLDKLSFEVLDTTPVEGGYAFEINEEKGLAKIENESLVISTIE